MKIKNKIKNGRESIFFYTCRRNFQVQSCGQAMAPEMLLQRGGCSTVSDIFIYFPPSAIKVGGEEEKNMKSASPTADGRDIPLKVTGEKRCTFKEMQQRISDADVRACSP